MRGLVGSKASSVLLFAFLPRDGAFVFMGIRSIVVL